MVGVAEISRVKDIDIALMDDLGLRERYFVKGIREELQPVLGLVEYFRDEDEGGAIWSGGLDVDASEFDLL